MVVEARRITDDVATNGVQFEYQRTLINSLNSFGYEDGAQVGRAFIVQCQVFLE